MDDETRDLLGRLSMGGAKVAHDLAARPDLSKDVVDALIAMPCDHSVRAVLASRGDLDVDQQWRMLRSGFPPVLLSSNTCLAPAVQEWLAGVLVQDAQAELLAQNPTVTRETCRILATDAALHPLLGANPGLDPGILSHWLSSGDLVLVAHAAANPALQSSEVEALAAYGDVLVRQRLAANPALPARLQEAWMTQSRLHAALARNPALAPLLQHHLAGAGDVEVRLLVAQRSDLAPETAAVLSFDPDPGVVGALVRGDVPATPAWSVRALRHRPLDLESIREGLGCDMESWTSLASSWSGSADDLAEAARLLRRGECGKR